MTLRNPLLPTLINPLYGPLSGRYGGSSFDAAITDIFSGGQNGFAIAAWKLNTLFQERTGASASTPAGIGDPVGTIADVSGNGKYATAAGDSKRGILRQTGDGLYYIEMDGLDDSYLISSLTLGTEQYEWIGLEQTNGSPWFSEHSATANSNPGSNFYGSSANTWRINRDSGTHDGVGLANWADGLHVIERSYVSGNIGKYFKDGTEQSNVTVNGTARSESDVTDQYNIASRNQASLFSAGKLFVHVIVDGTNPSASKVLALRQAIADKAGVTL